MPVGQERFGKVVNEDRLAELEGLRDFLRDGVQQVDAQTQKLAAPVDRMKQLLTAKDKKAMLLEMAGGSHSMQHHCTLTTVVH